MTVPQLHALAHGDLGAWDGIPADADAAWVRAALDGGVEARGATLLSWRGGVTGPEGLLAWLEDGRVALIELPHPAIPLAAVAALGEPELELASAWSRAGVQRAWPSRGLAVHATFAAVVRVTAFAAMTADAFQAHRFAHAGQPPRRP